MWQIFFRIIVIITNKKDQFLWRKNKHKRTVFIAIKMIKQNYISVFIMKKFFAVGKFNSVSQKIYFIQYSN